MSEDERPDPDQLLRQLKRQEESSKRGRLRVFLGMSAGVGKTFAMLRAAQTRIREGTDLVIGVVETHGRAETIALTQGIPVIPKKEVDYKGVRLSEMDLDAILKRRPTVVLVDELAHTNVPGSRHTKRYQDVLELLDAGIEVFTTLNVQHLESRKDLVEKIVNVAIRETVPDSILELAGQVELIDISPEELLKRLKEGKVYLGDAAERAVQNFFKQDTLTALREIALRLTAENVDHELQRIREAKSGREPWPANERLMVAISHSPFSETLIRTTRRLAFNLEAPWIAVHIDTGLPLNDQDQAQLSRNIALARELNAEVMTTADADVVAALKRIARTKNVTQLVVGRPVKSKLRDLLEGGSLVDRLVQDNWEIDVHVLRQDRKSAYRRRFLPKLNFETGFLPYWNIFCLFFGISFLSGFLDPLIGYRAVGFLFLLAVLGVGQASTLGPVVFAGALSAVVWIYFFIPPRMTFMISQPEDVIMCITYFIVAIVTGMLTARLRRHEIIIREREERTNVLYEILKEISSAREKSVFLPRVLNRVGQLFNANCGVLLKTRDGKLGDSQFSHAVFIDKKERAVAEWAFEKRKVAGWSTETLSQSKALYIPMSGNQETIGVFVFEPQSARKLSYDQESLLFSVVGQIGLFIERHFIDKRIRESERLEESERLHQTLLNSISHEMRTPLTAIMGTAAMLEDPHTRDSAELRHSLAMELNQAGERLNRVIENLLDMSRLSSGAIAIRKEWHDVHDLVGVTLSRMSRVLEGREVAVDIPDNLPLVEMDFRLLEHALTNLLMNAVIYTPPRSAIRLIAQLHKTEISITIEDRGPGIPEESIPYLFDKFYRVPGSPAGGTGLGLSIVKGIVEFHRGRVKVENNPVGGTKFTITLPLGEPPRGPDELER
jgi:two-component system sensor histidine kinase KdpD